LKALHHVKSEYQAALIAWTWSHANKDDGADEIWKDKGDHT
jgi:hypothetical protein